MSVIEGNIKDLVLRLFEIDAIKFGSYVMKSGKTTPIYLDLRVIISYPEVMENVADIMYEAAKHISADHICGVPYTALPIATLISVKQLKPMLIRRKEAKSYGTGNIVEGCFKSGQTCIIVEDVITSGSSVLETKAVLESAGLRVNSCVVLVDRCQGGRATLEAAGVEVVSLLTLPAVVRALHAAGKVDDARLAEVLAYFDNTQQIAAPVASPRLTTSYADRAVHGVPAAARLLRLMARKATNLCVAADLAAADDILALAKQVGPEICLLKLHLDLIDDATPAFAAALRALAAELDFLVMEDRKYADIGHVSRLQFENGVLRLADVVTAHAIAGRGMLDALQAASLSSGPDSTHGCFLVVEMSTDENLFTPQYQADALALATSHPFVCGVVSQRPAATATLGLLQLTPGVRALAGGDGQGQSYATPASAVARGADILVVGRGITGAADPAAAAKSYRAAAWDAYLERVK